MMLPISFDEIQTLFGPERIFKKTELAWNDPTKGIIFKSFDSRKKIFWTVQTEHLICIAPADKADPYHEYFCLYAVVEEIANKVRIYLTSNVDPTKVKGIKFLKGPSLDNIKEAVAYLDEWRLDESNWLKDPEFQRMMADRTAHNVKTNTTKGKN